ncbi:RidA family protein [Francisella sp. SYW-9]|uniref:RidA family protein n=1 Tax=Francisella sp. SYW-9 TaxID=2610888 RepID=UPI00123D597E|nr:RidA family protein [Francisella sp. SYW-9]
MNYKKAIKTDLPPSKSPFEWVITSNKTLYTAQIPIDKSGRVVDGGIESQSRQVMENLKHTLESANLTIDATLQVLIYVTDREYLATFNQIYSEYFKAPYPNRAAVVVAGLARKEMLVELVVYATTEQNK